MNIGRFTATLNLQESCNLNRHLVDDTDHIGWGINLEESLPDKLLDYLGVEDEDDIQTDHTGTGRLFTRLVYRKRY